MTPAIAPAANWYWNGSAIIGQNSKNLGVRFTSGADMVKRERNGVFDDKKMDVGRRENR